MNLRIRSLPFLLVAAACAQEPPPEPVPPKPVWVAGLDHILAAHVHGERVDYEALRKQDAGALRQLLDQLAAVDVAKLDRPARLAFYLDLYNATMLQAVLDHVAKDPKWTPAAAEFAVFEERRVRLASGVVTLNHLENEIVRKQFADPRIHVALVCGARSCPPLPDRAFAPADLDGVLDRRFAAFLADPSRNRVDRAAKVVRLSRLFEWYAADFGGEAGVRKLLGEHFGTEVARYRIEYLDYDWSLNAVQPPERAGK